MHMHMRMRMRMHARAAVGAGGVFSEPCLALPCLFAFADKLLSVSGHVAAHSCLLLVIWARQ